MSARWLSLPCALIGLALPPELLAQGLEAMTVAPAEGGGQTYTLSIQILLFMTALSLLPGALLMMTSFARIIIVLAILRQALGTQNTPSNQLLIGLALFLTAYIMMPVFQEAYDVGFKPYLEEQVTLEVALERASGPVRGFMLAQTRDNDLRLFADLAGDQAYASPDEVPLTVLLPAFATSELKTGFQIGFLLFIPFLIIDLVVASVLMSMGMMMLSPLIISLPFKIMLFVLIDGWALVFGTLAGSFQV
ncbi:MAG: flagellar biosynthetic protein FliP [Candidatus Sedimenticola endophacoides]|uniref:Flagellar biosynthetic protein FliP n=1 Tax=Candidatus Sedimenticola endophacoides TaxID=2548426 RepID=A0A657PZD6_9GAMM|nr:MAG: flagellar biosynthetic protein FliP [Candidatus Sedimenticola endophacoides]OQX33609.1 MAG: flagellar biosynthetic protein FliP [Candidatus Sedimenticola endophacoides]OQX34024.1 MAG: flagellar biosynthetic protein FliP [Candidatus Sedimenticola endophacoides]OQX38771.1 MAG: flagellar biosynthetic protein FliP [Candidatus Sedimenticola endophacoides]OQX45424.1 MAG: flagellar biosynthetic protein FliP [Candidatus Sedimenticola endophacoides]